MSDEAPRRSFASTGFLATLTTWIGSVATMLTSTDSTVRHWAAAGMVCLPALYLLCSTLIKRARLRATKPKAASPLALVSSLMAAPPPDPGKP